MAIPARGRYPLEFAALLAAARTSGLNDHALGKGAKPASYWAILCRDSTPGSFARSMFLSEHTVQDYLESVFAVPPPVFGSRRTQPPLHNGHVDVS